MDKDYKKLYEDALSRARDLHDNPPLGQPQIWMTCEKIFPELKESEDEKIRKSLIKLVRQSSEILSKQNQESMISWLEKQGEQHSWSEEDERMCQETIDWFEKKCFPYALESENPARESIKWLKSLKSQNRWKPSEEQIKTLAEWLKNHQYDGDSRYIYPIFQSLYNDLKNFDYAAI